MTRENLILWLGYNPENVLSLSIIESALHTAGFDSEKIQNTIDYYGTIEKRELHTNRDTQ